MKHILDAHGISHIVLPLLVVIVIAISGVGFMVASHADAASPAAVGVANDVFGTNCSAQLANYKTKDIKKFGTQKVANRDKAIIKYEKTVTASYRKYYASLNKVGAKPDQLLHKAELTNALKSTRSQLATKNQVIKSSQDQTALINAVCGITQDVAVYGMLGNTVKYQLAIDKLYVDNALAQSPIDTKTKIDALQLALSSVVASGDRSESLQQAFTDSMAPLTGLQQSVKAELASNKKPAKVAKPTKPKSGKLSAVYMVGDSISVGARPYLQTDLGKYYKRVKINPSGSRSILHAGVTDERSSGLQAVQNDKAFIKNADAVIIELGTNQNENFEDSMRSLIKEIRGYNPGATVYWVNIFSGGPVNAPQINDTITKLESPQKYTIIHTVGKGISLSPDGVHPDADGQKKFAQLVADSAH